MARTPSTMQPLGTPVPEFSLPDTNGKYVKASDFLGQPLLVIFLSNHCPFVKHVRGEISKLGNDFSHIGIVGINSNDVIAYPEDSPEKMKEEVQIAGYSFPYLFDESQEIAKSFGAACTPDFFLFDKNHKLYYRGQLDESRPGNGKPVTGHDLRVALHALLENKPAPIDQKASLGCNIKWKKGNEPKYFGGN